MKEIVRTNFLIYYIDKQQSTSDIVEKKKKWFVHIRRVNDIYVHIKMIDRRNFLKYYIVKPQSTSDT